MNDIRLNCPLTFKLCITENLMNLIGVKLIEKYAEEYLTLPSVLTHNLLSDLKSQNHFSHFFPLGNTQKDKAVALSV